MTYSLSVWKQAAVK